MKIFTIRDSKAEAYHNPFFATNIALAIRMLEQTVQDQSTLLAKYPADFELFIIGEFDDQAGLVEPTPSVSLGRLIDILSLEITDEK